MQEDITQEIFIKQWQTYRKIMNLDYMFHKAVYSKLHSILLNDAPQGFRFLDIACGDASATAYALKGTGISSYCGIDISLPALRLAADELKDLGCSVTLVPGDFVEALRAWSEPVDVVWIGQSLHHLRADAKVGYMAEIKGRLSEGGLLVIWEPTTREGEDRAEWLRRFETGSRPFWPEMTSEEWSAMVEHIRAADYPETVKTWLSLGREAGFVQADEVLATPRDLSKVYVYRMSGISNWFCAPPSSSTPDPT